jgi:hypothetical protein
MQKAWRFPRTGPIIVGKVTYMGEDPHNIISCIQILFCIKNLELTTTQSRFPLHSRALLASFRLEHIGRLRDAKCNADPGE